VTFTLTPHISLDARYFDTDSDAEAIYGPGFATDSLIVGTLKATF
jgi:hypothetical protein